MQTEAEWHNGLRGDSTCIQAVAYGSAEEVFILQNRLSGLMPSRELCGIQAPDDVEYGGIQSTKLETPRVFLVEVLHELDRELYRLTTLGSCV